MTVREFQDVIHGDGADQPVHPGPRTTRPGVLVRMAGGRFELIYAPQVKGHLRAIDRKHYSLIRRTIEEQLLHEPGVETRNRKPLRPGPVLEGEWELRFGSGNQFRVFYEIDDVERSVLILAIGVEEGSRLLIGGSEVQG